MVRSSLLLILLGCSSQEHTPTPPTCVLMERAEPHIIGLSLSEHADADSPESCSVAVDRLIFAQGQVAMLELAWNNARVDHGLPQLPSLFEPILGTHRGLDRACVTGDYDRVNEARHRAASELRGGLAAYQDACQALLADNAVAN